MAPKSTRQTRSSKRSRNDEDEKGGKTTYARKLSLRKKIEQKSVTSKVESVDHSIYDRDESRISTSSPEVVTTCSRLTNFNINFEARMKPPCLPANLLFTHMQRSLNIFHHQYLASIGQLHNNTLNQRKNVVSPVADMVSNFQLYRTGSPFDRRVTAMEWHPSNPDLIAVGSKGGDIFLWNIETVNNNDNFIQGRGPGGNVSAMKFHPHLPSRLYTSTLDGRLTLQDFTGRQKDIYLDTMTWDFWYCSVDVSASRKVVVTGDNVGNTLLLSDEGKQLWKHKLHKGKVTHTEFSPREDWLLCTASVDHTVKMWDIRMISGKNSALSTLQHIKGVNSAYFSLTDGCRLLTTDQDSDIRVYLAPEWRLETTISHPHRFFQHITPIKASWHPQQDLIVVGRYPDQKFPGFTPNEKRTIDVFEAGSGSLVAQLHDTAAPGIVSLNKFSPQGNKLASGMGVNILIWSRQEELENQRESLLEKFKQHGSTRTPEPNHRPGRRTKSAKMTKTDNKLQTKVKTKTKKL